MPRTTKVTPSATAGPRRATSSKRAKPAEMSAISVEAVARRAYELFLEGGGTHGSDVEHWLRAEQELMSTVVPARPARRAVGRKAKA